MRRYSEGVQNNGLHWYWHRKKTLLQRTPKKNFRAKSFPHWVTWGCPAWTKVNKKQSSLKSEMLSIQKSLGLYKNKWGCWFPSIVLTPYVRQRWLLPLSVSPALTTRSHVSRYNLSTIGYFLLCLLYGRQQIRGAIYMATMTSIWANTNSKELFYQLRKNGKPWKLSLTAVSNKFIWQTFVVVKRREPYVNGYVSTTPMSA